jgi:LmbE family N-acetylglucosaminyl deacetylase
MVISPHPDDASISCGGLLGSLPSGVPRSIVTMTTGARAKIEGMTSRDEVAWVREQEVRKEAAILSSDPVFLRSQYYESGHFETTDVARLQEEILRRRPAWIFAPSLADPHPTHRLTRQILDEALLELMHRDLAPVEVWTFEGPWHQHPRALINALLLYDDAVALRKRDAVRAHRSQIARVPFDQGADALATLRAVGFSESHLGGTEPGRLTALPHIETYIREVYARD